MKSNTGHYKCNVRVVKFTCIHTPTTREYYFMVSYLTKEHLYLNKCLLDDNIMKTLSITISLILNAHIYGPALKAKFVDIILYST